MTSARTGEARRPGSARRDRSGAPAGTTTESAAFVPQGAALLLSASLHGLSERCVRTAKRPGVSEWEEAPGCRVTAYGCAAAGPSPVFPRAFPRAPPPVWC
ncbi:hypothetical protein Sfulv_29070 [Streptomyces fulvorobeus]|uniref:Uncharacterized protein n=1 Tax=Streptomyces fulvorobeus TaxID=284028 RepID=A0A7J0C8N8_9ACTN|nr:hypothetical protein Sfulv_29070 [Streptomyces fulvorobeus]